MQYTGITLLLLVISVISNSNDDILLQNKKYKLRNIVTSLDLITEQQYMRMYKVYNVVFV